MKIIFCKSNWPLSLMIRWGLNEPVSHVGIVFDNKIVFHSNLLGGQIAWFHSFVKHIEVVFSTDFPLSLQDEETVYQAVINKGDGRPYDFTGFFYFVYRALLWRVFKRPFPKTNKWEMNGAALCTEILSYLPPGYEVKTEKALAITSPYQLYLQTKDLKNEQR